MAQSHLIPSPAPISIPNPEKQEQKKEEEETKNSENLNYLNETQLTSFEITWQRFIEVFGSYFSVSDKNEV